jgi:cytidylate kinase
MKRNSILAIHGFSGAGKSAAKKAVMEFLYDHKYFSTGDTARAFAKDLGMEITEYMKHARENNIPIDAKLDDSLKKLSTTDQKWVVDSRLGYYHLNFDSHGNQLKGSDKISFNVLLCGDSTLIAKRRWRQNRKDNYKKYKRLTIAQTAEMIRIRDKKDIEKYAQLYPETDCTDWKNYDLVIITTETSKNQTASDILRYYAMWQEGKYKRRLLIRGSITKYL